MGKKLFGVFPIFYQITIGTVWISRSNREELISYNTLSIHEHGLSAHGTLNHFPEPDSLLDVLNLALKCLRYTGLILESTTKALTIKENLPSTSYMQTPFLPTLCKLLQDGSLESEPEAGIPAQVMTRGSAGA